MLKSITLLLALAATTVQATELPTIKAYSPKVCLACIDWAEHLRQQGFKVDMTQTDDMEAIKRKLKIPKELEAIPSATVAGYFIEGHVHADQIKELLSEKPKALGLAVPGLPLGAPGREYSSPTCQTAYGPRYRHRPTAGAPRVLRNPAGIAGRLNQNLGTPLMLRPWRAEPNNRYRNSA